MRPDRRLTNGRWKNKNKFMSYFFSIFCNPPNAFLYRRYGKDRIKVMARYEGRFGLGYSQAAEISQIFVRPAAEGYSQNLFARAGGADEPHRVADPPGSQLLWRFWPAGLRLQCGCAVRGDRQHPGAQPRAEDHPAGRGQPGHGAGQAPLL